LVPSSPSQTNSKEILLAPTLKPKHGFTLHTPECPLYLHMGECLATQRTFPI